MAETHVKVPIRGDRMYYVVEILNHVLHERSQFQTIDIYDTPTLGRLFLLDGHVQLSTLDEHAYHEPLVHIPLLSVPSARSALVVGGGDGGVLRELCKHRSLERIDMVEIDRSVVEASKKHLPGISDGAFEDPRVNLTTGDAFPYVKNTEHKYDLIVVDSTDIYEAESGLLSERLFTEDFYQDCRQALTEKGIVVTQADNPLFCSDATEDASALLASVFPSTGTFYSLVPSFGGFSACAWGSVSGSVTFDHRLPDDLPLRYLNEVTMRLAARDLPY